ITGIRMITITITIMRTATVMRPHQARRAATMTMTTPIPMGMHTATITAMTTATSIPLPRMPELTPLLQLIWLASPALPVGGFSYSEGLEAAIDAGRVHDEASCGDWLLDQLLLTQARGDLALIAQAIPAWQAADVLRLRELSDWVHATRESQELRLQTEQMGRSLWAWLREMAQVPAADLQTLTELAPTWPMALALALAHSGASREQALMSAAFGWAENMTQAALKSVPLGQSSGQRMLARLARHIPEAVQTALSLDDEGRQVMSPMLAILSARHETQYSRLFRS
ncbi:MAG: Urease accessory protein UreF, partial [Pseudomonadota bacterium]